MTPANSRKQEQLEFLEEYWAALMSGDMESFAPLVADHCVVHYPGNHFLSGDHVGRAAVVDLYRRLYRLGIEQGTFIGEFHDAVTSDEHACALITYRIVLGPNLEIPGEAVGVFHIENHQMVEYWLLERDQGMINDVVKISGRASLAGGSKPQLALGAAKQPFALVRTIRRLRRIRRGTNKKML